MGALTLGDLAAIATALTGREVRRIVMPDEEWVAAKVTEGVPLPMARSMLGFFEAARRGDFAAVDPLLGALLGRPPRPMRDVLAMKFGAAA